MQPRGSEPLCAGAGSSRKIPAEVGSREKVGYPSGRYSREVAHMGDKGGKKDKEKSQKQKEAQKKAKADKKK